MSAVNQVVVKFASMAVNMPEDNLKNLKDDATIKKTSEEQDAVKKTSEQHDTVKRTGEAKGLLGMPDELLLNIASNLSAVDNGKVRLTCKTLVDPFREGFYKAMANEFTIYPRYETFCDLYDLIQGGILIAGHVRRIVLVEDGLATPSNDYGWYWEEMECDTEGRFTARDWEIIRNINRAHEDDIVDNGGFLITGLYRTALTALFTHLFNLEVIEVRHLKHGEHVPHWEGPKLMKDLSIYHDDMYRSDMFYGGWQYDEILQRPTIYEDEFGDVVEEPNAGPQATFKEDLENARLLSGTRAVVVYQ